MRSKEREVVKWVVSVLVVLIVVSFSVFQAKNLILGPQVTIESPLNGEVVKESLTEIEGSAKNVSEIKLNGRNIFIDEEGKFKEPVLLSYGYNRIVMEARDRFNREVKKELKLVLK